MPDTMDEGKATCKFVIGKLPGFWTKLTEVIQRAKRRSPGAQLSTWITEEHARSLAEFDELLSDAVSNYEEIINYLKDKNFAKGVATVMMAIRMKNKLGGKKRRSSVVMPAANISAVAPSGKGT